MKILTHNQPIRLAAWADDASATVFTTRGYAIEHGQDPDKTEARARHHGHELNGSIYSSGALVGDRAYGKQLRDARIAAAAAAVTLERGEVVEIDGRRYAVHIARGNDGRYPVNCDPIHFLPAGEG